MDIKMKQEFDTMCKCRTKVQFEIDSGELINLEPLEDNNCGGFDECLWCVINDEELKDGLYIADLACEVYQVRYAEGVEYEGESILENIILVPPEPPTPIKADTIYEGFGIKVIK